MALRVLIIGAGGREHALAWKIAKSPILEHTYVCPGNAGTSQEPKTSNVDNISPDDFPALVAFALKNQVRRRSFAHTPPSLILRIIDQPRHPRS